MKIAFVDEDLSQRTGSRRFTYEVTRQLQSLGHEVEIYTTKLDARKCFQEFLGMPIHLVPGKKAISGESPLLSRRESDLLKIPTELAYLWRQTEYALEISRSIADAQCDVALYQYHGEHWLLPYFYNFYEPIGMVYLNVLRPMPPPFNVPFMEATLRRRLIDGLYDSLPFRSLKQASFRKLSTFLAPSRFQLEQARRQGTIGHKKAAVVPLGIDHDRFYPVDKSGDFALYLGRIHPHKSLELAVMAMKRAPESCSLTIAGDIEPQHMWYKSKLASLAEEMEISDRFEIVLYPSDSEVVRLMQECSIFLFPSTIDTFGLVVLEAMACGKPVVACNRGGVPGVLGDAGFLLEPSVVEWASAVNRLTLDSSLRRRMGEKALERSKAFSWEKTTDRLLKTLSGNSTEMD
ncbi:MAG: glycosyltransferase family 4 protein [Candidatus Bathyarchaeia archaeon]